MFVAEKHGNIKDFEDSSTLQSEKTAQIHEELVRVKKRF